MQTPFATNLPIKQAGDKFGLLQELIKRINKATTYFIITVNII
jgi:hypothetical protein